MLLADNCNQGVFIEIEVKVNQKLIIETFSNRCKCSGSTLKVKSWDWERGKLTVVRHLKCERAL